MGDFVALLKEYQTWVVGFVGAVLHVSLRPDVPSWHHLVMILIGLPVSVFIIAPAAADIWGLSEAGEKTVVFFLAMFGRDVLVGFTKVSRQFAADPVSVVAFWRKGK